MRLFKFCLAFKQSKNIFHRAFLSKTPNQKNSNHHMSAITMSGFYFNNPIKILHRLREAGFTEQQAEAHVEILSDYIEHGLATKRDLQDIKVELKELELRIDLKLKELESRLIIKTAAIVGSIVGFISLIEKFF